MRVSRATGEYTALCAEGHRRLYSKYWEYTAWRIREARGEGFIKTPFGYSMHVHRTVGGQHLAELADASDVC